MITQVAHYASQGIRFTKIAIDFKRVTDIMSPPYLNNDDNINPLRAPHLFDIKGKSVSR